MSDSDTQNDYGFTGEDHGPLPTGEFVQRGMIGKVNANHRWFGGIIKEPFQTSEGKEIPKGPLYFPGDKESADKFVKQYLGDKYFVKPCFVMAVPLASVTNMTDDAKGKWGLVQSSHALVQGIGKNYKAAKSNAAGFNLVTLPAVVDAWARYKKWYEEPLFDPSAIGDIHNELDTSDLLDRLQAMRVMIWSKLGTQDWIINSKEAGASDKLADALQFGQKSWDRWAELLVVQNPAPGAIYETVKVGLGGHDRNRVPVILRFFAGEREAIAAGNKASETSTIKWDDLSDKAKETYGDVETLRMSIPEITDALKTKAKPKVAAEFGLTMGDLNIVIA